jgi:hypothetical protein
MGLRTRSTYRTQWPRIAGALAMGVAGATVLAADTLTKRRRIAALNFAALLVHQYEEYCDPGYFPAQFNRGLFKSDTPRTYPLNTDTAISSALSWSASPPRGAWRRRRGRTSTSGRPGSSSSATRGTNPSPPAASSRT